MWSSLGRTFPAWHVDLHRSFGARLLHVRILHGVIDRLRWIIREDLQPPCSPMRKSVCQCECSVTAEWRCMAA